MFILFYREGNFSSFSGGILSIAQMLIIAVNASDWTTITGDLTKLGLGVFSICFDLFFMLQHYVWYSSWRGYEALP
jgi:cystinosin